MKLSSNMPPTAKLRLCALFLTALLPQPLKRWVLRTAFGYQIGRGVRIGLSIIDAGTCEIGDGVVIGHGNLFIGTRRLLIGHRANVGHLNVFRGGDEINLGDRCEILRLNVVNSIVDPDVTNPTEPCFSLGEGGTLTEGHKFDFTDRISIGAGTIVAGRHSSFWTHIRQQTRPISIGNSCYIGSGVQCAPGSAIPNQSVVGMGAVVVDAFNAPDTLIAGVPARVVKNLDESHQPLLRVVEGPQ